MVCHHSQYGMMIEKRYFESILKVGNQEIDDFIDIANLRAKECFFINNQKLSYTDRDDIIREAVESDFDVLSQYSNVKSIFLMKSQLIEWSMKWKSSIYDLQELQKRRYQIISTVR